MAAILPVLTRKLHVAGAKYYADAAQDEYEKAAQVDIENLKAKDDLVHDLNSRLEQLENENVLLIDECDKNDAKLKDTLERHQELIDKHKKQEEEYERTQLILREENADYKKHLLELQNSISMEKEQSTRKIKYFETLITELGQETLEKNQAHHLTDIDIGTENVSNTMIPPSIAAPKSAFYQDSDQIPLHPVSQTAKDFTPTLPQTGRKF